MTPNVPSGEGQPQGIPAREILIATCQVCHRMNRCSRRDYRAGRVICEHCDCRIEPPRRAAEALYQGLRIAAIMGWVIVGTFAFAAVSFSIESGGCSQAQSTEVAPSEYPPGYRDAEFMLRPGDALYYRATGELAGKLVRVGDVGGDRMVWIDHLDMEPPKPITSEAVHRLLMRPERRPRKKR